MKFVYFGYDFMLGGVRRLLEDGHSLAGVFTFQCDNIFNFNRETLALAAHLDTPVVLTAPQPEDIARFAADGAEVFLCAGYPFKIPPIPDERAYGINLHPSFLPQGRGLMPVPHILLHAPQAAGFTVHKLAERIDAGDILHQEFFELALDETVETYCARIAMKAPGVLSMILKDLPRFWREARPQDESKASRFSAPDEAMRLLDWGQSVSEIKKTARAFGRFGALGKLPSKTLVVYALDGWTETHAHAPGTIVCTLSRETIIAAKDGYICLKDFQDAQTG